MTTEKENNTDLERFLAAQADTYQQALAEVKAGRKTSHWIWWIFPQMKGLGRSERSWYYGISDAEEARQYINHPILRDRLVEISECVLQSKNSLYEIFGSDTKKVMSCMKLFASVSGIQVFEQVIKKHQAEKRCRKSMID